MEKTSEDLISTIIVVTIIVIILAVFTFLFFLLFIKKKKVLQKEAIILKQAFEQELLKTQLEAREETLSSIGKELHDNIGQLLNSTKLLIGVSQRSISDPPETLVTANETLAKAIQELRTLSKSLDKEWLLQFSFMENLHAEVSRVNSSKSFHIQINEYDPLRLKTEQQIILFRIVQEVLQNAMKHSQAESVDLKIKEAHNQLLIVIADNGKGFSLNENRKEGVGILNIKHRTRLLGGTVSWHPAEPSGTIVTIQIPVNQI